MLVLTIKNDGSIRIGDQKIRISVSPNDQDNAEFWLWFDDQEDQATIERSNARRDTR